MTCLPEASRTAGRLVVDLATITPDGLEPVDALVDMVERALQRGTPISDDELAQAVGHLVTMPASVSDTWTQAEDLAARLAPLFANGGTLLDVGGGLGAYTAALLGVAPRARAVLVDAPGTTAAARRFLVGFGTRVEIREIDLLTQSLPDLASRVALVADVLHVLPVEATPRLLRAAFAAIQPGGQIVVVEIEPGSLRGRLFRLVAWLRGADVRLHDEPALATLLQAAGFTSVTRIPSSAPWEPLVLAASKGHAVDLFAID